MGVTQLIVKMECDPDQKVPRHTYLRKRDNFYFLTEVSATACPVFSYNSLVKFATDNKYVFGPIFIAIGLFLTFLGLKLLGFALFFAFTIVTTWLILFVVYAKFLADVDAEWVHWLVLSAAIIVGLFAGMLGCYCQKLAAALLAAWGGYTLGVLINTSFLYIVENSVLFWSINLGLALLCAFLAMLVYHPAIIVATSFVGAYLVMRGIGLMAGGFPNEYVLINMVKAGLISRIDPIFYFYLGGIIVMTAVGICSQWRMNRVA